MGGWTVTLTGRQQLYHLLISDEGMAYTTIYVDGSGGPRGGFGWLDKETGESFYEKRDGITNNQAEYMAIIAALEHLLLMVNAGTHVGDYKISIFSDSMNTVKQINNEYAINNDRLRELAMQAWSLLGKFETRPTIRWIGRKENLAGKMLGS